MNATCVLVNFPGYPTEPFSFVPDNGIAQLAGVLKAAGYGVVIEDFATVSTMQALYPAHLKQEMKGLAEAILARVSRGEKPGGSESEALLKLETAIDAWQESGIRRMACALAARVAAVKPAFVGFKLWTGQGFTGSIAMAEEIKKALPNVKTYGGGPNVDWFMEHSARFAPVFDAMAYGEGEGTILELAEHALGRRRIEDVAGIITPDGRTNPPSDPVVLDDLPLPLYDADSYPAMSGDGEKVRVFLVDESRGCPNRCNFCCHPTKSGKRRAMKPARFTDRLEILGKKHGARHFRFAGSNPPVAQREGIAREILARGMDVRFGGFAHVSNGCNEDFGLLAAAGCRVLSFGVESGSQDILDRAMNKKVKVSDIRSALKACRQAGIAAVASLIVPAPFETLESLEETFNLMVESRPDSTMVHFPAMVPGTAWEKDRAKFGFEAPTGADYADRLMTLRLRHYASPVLWRPVEWFKLAGRAAPAMAAMTSGFMRRLQEAGLETQIYDSVFLISDATGTSARRTADEFGRAMADGDADLVRHLVRTANRGL